MVLVTSYQVAGATAPCEPPAAATQPTDGSPGLTRKPAVAPDDDIRRAAPRRGAVPIEGMTTGAITTSSSETAEGRRLSTPTPWCRPDGPMRITVGRGDSSEPLALAVLDRDGRSLAEVSVVPGETDLLALVPAIRQTDRTLWLQLMEGERSVGQPLWIIPMRAPPPVRTVRSLRATNSQPYTRIVGWGDRAFDPADPETRQAMASWTSPDPVVTAGFRLEPAQDVRLHTSLGTMQVALAPDAAPATVDNFLRLARAGFYDGTTFHRIVPLDRDGRPFVVQGGDPTGTGDGGPGWNLAMEPSDLPHARGVLGMARGDDPHTAGSQFYIGLSREGTARLDGQYCTFGVLVDGWPVLEAIAATPVGDAATGRPKDAPVLQRVEPVPATPRTPGTPARPAAEAVAPVTSSPATPAP